MNSIRVSARGLRLQQDKIYLIKENTKQNVDCWFLPGGKIENRESIENGLKRELCEELGVDKSDIKVYNELIGSYSFQLKSGDLNINLVFKTDFPIPKSIKNSGEDKVIDQKMVHKDNILDYLADSVSKEIESNILPNI